MGYGTNRHSRGGRPRLNRDRHAYVPRIEPELSRALQEQADQVGLRLATYLELLLAEVHDYHGQYLAEVSAPLPTAVPVEELRKATHAFAQAPGRGARGPGAVNHTVRADRPLANEIDRRCRELDMAYADYLRAIFREAAGLSHAADAAPRQQVAELTKEGELRLAEAS